MVERLAREVRLARQPITENDPVALPFDPARKTTFEAIAPTNTITYTYDALGHLHLKTWPTGQVEQHWYVPTMPTWFYYPDSPLVGGRTLEAHVMADGLGAMTIFFRDAMGRQVAIQEFSYFGGIFEKPFTYYQCAFRPSWTPGSDHRGRRDRIIVNAGIGPS